MPDGTLFQVTLSVNLLMFEGTLTAPSDVPFWNNSTLLSVPSLSAATAVIVRFAGAMTKELLAGAVMLMVGGASTVTLTGADVAVAPPSSVATAVSETVPDAAGVQFAVTQRVAGCTRQPFIARAKPFQVRFFKLFEVE